MNQFGKTYAEPGREIPVVEKADVVVCGGGPAGVTAALAAARAGARVRLLEMQGCLGGIWTAGLLSWVLDMGNKGGILTEILDRILQKDAGRRYENGNFMCDTETLKLLLEEMCAEAGVVVQLHTIVTAAVRDKSGRLSMVVTESKSGRQAWAAHVFIDATGDGDVGARAGCGFDTGRPEDGGTQPVSLIAVVGGIDPEEVKYFQSTRGGRAAKQRLRVEMERAGVSPSYNDPFLAHMSGGLFLLMANHIYCTSASDAGQLTGATLQARAEIHRLVNALRSLGKPWGGLQIVTTAPQIGVREGRRLHGLYTVTASDIAGGVCHADGICKVSFGVDVHSTDPKNSKGYDNHGIRSKPYDIPIRALIAKDVPGLVMAGRCISGDFFAHASYRVTGDAAVMGQAAGTLAALAAAAGRLPQEVPWADVEKALGI